MAADDPDDPQLSGESRGRFEENTRALGREPIVRRPVGMQMWYADLPVRSIEETAEYFINVLGFYCPGYGYAGELKVNCQIHRDKAVIGLNALRPGHDPRPLRDIGLPDSGYGNPLVDAVVLVADLAAYHTEVTARGAQIVRSDLATEEPTFVVEDPNGYHVMFWESPDPPGKLLTSGDVGQTTSLTLATAADLDLLAGFMRGLRADDPMPAATLADDATAVAALSALLADPALGRAWVIRSGGGRAGTGTACDRPVGYAVLTFVHSIEFGGRCGFVDELYVEPAARGHGIGRRALGLIADAARALGVRVLLLEVSPENERAAGLYRSAGFAARKYRLMTKRLTGPPT